MTRIAATACLLLAAACTAPQRGEPAATPSTAAPTAAATAAAAAAAPVAYATQRDVPPLGKPVASAPLPPQGELVREASAAPPRNAGAIGQLWFDRLQAAGVLGGAGLSGKSDTSPVSSLDVLMTAADFDTWVAREGWGTPPRHIDWRFVSPLVRERISPAAQARVRFWPASTSRTGMQLEALIGGRVVLEDGCFFVEDAGPGPRKLAWFHAETGLDVDAKGYLVLIDRVTGQTRARIGEKVGAAGPNPEPGGADLAALHEACGPGDVLNIGNPQSYPF